MNLVNLSRRRIIQLSATTMAFHLLPSLGLAATNDEITIGYDIAPKEFIRDPCMLKWAAAANMLRMCLDPLVEIGGENHFHYTLAEKISSDPSGTNWYIDLRPNIYWLGGARPDLLTSDHVAANLRHWMEMAAQKSPIGQQLDQSVSEIRVLSSQRLQLTLKSPNYLLQYVFTAYGALLMHPEDGWDFKPTSRRTGPFKMADYTPKKEAFFVPEPNYWDVVKRAQFSVRFLHVEGASNQNFDMLPSLQPDRAAELIKRGMEIKQNILPDALNLHADCQGPLANKQLRQALRACMEPEGIVKSIYGYGRASDHTHASPIHLDYPKGFQFIHSYNPEKARELWGGIDLEIPVYYQQDLLWQKNAVTTYVQQAAKVGIRLVPQPVDEAVMDKNWGSFPGLTATKWVARPLVFQLYEIIYQSSAAWNPSHWENLQFDSLLNKLRALPVSTEGRSAELMSNAMKLLHEEGPMVQLAWLDCNKAFDPNRLDVQSVVVGSTGFIQSNLLRAPG